MTSRILSAALISASLVALASSASAETVAPKVIGKSRVAVVTPPSEYVGARNASPRADISKILYMERCKGGCMVTKGLNDAQNYSSSVPKASGTSMMSEYRNGAGLTGADADAEWALLVQCMKEVWSPFNVEITDVKPPPTTDYHMAIIAGTPGEIGWDNGVLGVAPLDGQCKPFDNVISFSFANAHRQVETSSRVNNLCWTASQEAAHAFGLDHSFEFLDKRSACNDPMTYREDCGGQKFFRNEAARCGDIPAVPRECQCTATQNTHVHLLQVFGPGTSLIDPPEVTVTMPQPSQAADSLPENVLVTAYSQRGVARLEMRLNGWKWAEIKGAAFGGNGQPETAYPFKVPAQVPDSVYDLVVRACDDLNICTESPTITVTKGPAGGCQSADTCLAGQKCDAGKCYWDAPVGEIGDSCTYNEYCKGQLCAGYSDDSKICTNTCVIGQANGCAIDLELECVDSGNGAGVCLAPEESGCCSTGSGNTTWMGASLAAMVLGLLVRPRRRRSVA